MSKTIKNKDKYTAVISDISRKHSAEMLIKVCLLTGKVLKRIVYYVN